ncbi:MAG: ABC transporter permease [Pirellulales bacterium]|nr:ABC transporter permease [Pirellulales bacterium]
MVVAGGCSTQPPPPPKPVSRWIEVTTAKTAASAQPTAAAGLTRKDVDAIKATLPTLHSVVWETLGSSTAKQGSRSRSVRVSATVPELASALEEVSGAKMTAGRFLKKTDTSSGAPAAVISGPVADELFGEADPIGQSLLIGGQAFTIVGVVAGTTQQTGSLTGDVFVLASPAINQTLQWQRQSQAEVDRLWLLLQTLDQVLPAEKLVEEYLGKKHPNVEFTILNPR